MTTEIKVSGTKATLKVAPKYPLETVRKLDAERGTKNPPHMHINIFAMLKAAKIKRILDEES